MEKQSHIFKFSLLATLFIFNISLAQQSPSVLVFSKTEGFRHQCIEEGIISLKKLGKENHFLVQATEDANEFIAALSDFDVVVFLNTTGNILNVEQQKEFEQFIEGGGGFVGVHAAADTEYEWPWFGDMVGAYFLSHPKQQQATIKVVNQKHLATNFLDKEWSKFDEWYNYKDINPVINVLMKLDESSYTGGENGENHPIAWFHEYKGGRIFYTGLGHTKESYKNPVFLKHVLGGILYAMGKPE